MIFSQAALEVKPIFSMIATFGFPPIAENGEELRRRTP
jgi:hypothetical protein